VAASPYTTTLMRIQFLLPWHSIRGYRHRLPPSGGGCGWPAAKGVSPGWWCGGIERWANRFDGLGFCVYPPARQSRRSHHYM